VPAEGNGARPSIFERLRRALRGIDHAGDPALPLGEALHPITLAAVVVLAVNDRVLEPRRGPGLAPASSATSPGLLFAPVVLSAAIGLALHLAPRLGLRVGLRCRPRDRRVVTRVGVRSCWQGLPSLID
jgi:hypothetical protein